MKDDLTSIGVGTPAPAFSARTLDGTSMVKSISNYKGEVVVLNIWATWCGPCREEMPSIQRLYSALGPKGLKVVAVSVDPEGKEQTIRDFAKEFGLTFEVLHDSSGVIQEIYRTAGVPETFVIGRDGLIRKRWIGGEDWYSEPNRRLVESLLAEPRN
jgi:peroxiredoxin